MRTPFPRQCGGRVYAHSRGKDQKKTQQIGDFIGKITRLCVAAPLPGQTQVGARHLAHSSVIFSKANSAVCGAPKRSE